MGSSSVALPQFLGVYQKVSAKETTQRFCSALLIPVTLRSVEVKS